MDLFIFCRKTIVKRKFCRIEETEEICQQAHCMSLIWIPKKGRETEKEGGRERD